MSTAFILYCVENDDKESLYLFSIDANFKVTFNAGG